MMQRSISPFPLAGSTFARSNALSSLAASKTSKLSLTSLISGAQKTIGTVNQIIPLYNQVKPMFQNSKALINTLKEIKFLPKKRNTQHTQKTFTPNKQPEIKKEEKPVTKEIHPQKNEPSKPYFA